MSIPEVTIDIIAPICNNRSNFQLNCLVHEFTILKWKKIFYYFFPSLNYFREITIHVKKESDFMILCKWTKQNINENTVLDKFFLWINYIAYVMK